MPISFAIVAQILLLKTSVFFLDTAQVDAFLIVREENKALDQRDPTVGHSSRYPNRCSMLTKAGERDDAEATSDACFRFPCEICNQRFPSRNALFRHLRTDLICAERAKIAEIVSVRKSFALLFSYDCRIKPECTITSEGDGRNHAFHQGESAGKILEQAFVDALLSGTISSENEEQPAVSLLSRTQSSLARLRAKDLEQDNDCMASGDVLVLSFSLPKYLVDPSRLEHLVNPLLSHIEENDGIHVDLLACKLLDDGLHAEQSCTQYAYHYLLPLSWLPHSDGIASWLLKNVDGNNKPATNPPTVDSLRRFKRFCRMAESERIYSQEIKNKSNNPDTSSKHRRLAAGRYGSLGHRERRPWHNFCSRPVSPNHESGWRVVDKCRMIGFPSKSHVLLEIRGDALLQGQVRRLVGILLAMTHGWLPETALDDSITTVYLVPTPPAPPRRMYLAEARFHFEEIRTKDETLFESSIGGPVFSRLSLPVSMTNLHNFIIADRAQAEAIEMTWLEQLKEKISPNIRDLLNERRHQGQEDDYSHDYTKELSPAPPVYQKVLSMLQSIVEKEEWPATSAARSGVIRDGKQNTSTSATNGGGSSSSSSENTVVDPDKNTRGSFTVINPTMVKDDDDHDDASHLTPLRGNQQFPDLALAVFELEEALPATAFPRKCLTTSTQGGGGGGHMVIDDVSANETRPPSSHCAINCDAQFTPHVDSGRGAGQSLSMIVGLGDYQGGSLGVEGESFDIRYQPVEFDGWKLRHWTNHFVGQRFSLVWFTPETKTAAMMTSTASRG